MFVYEDVMHEDISIICPSNYIPINSEAESSGFIYNTYLAVGM
jgi:hypothetical protein